MSLSIYRQEEVVVIEGVEFLFSMPDPEEIGLCFADAYLEAQKKGIDLAKDPKSISTEDILKLRNAEGWKRGLLNLLELCFPEVNVKRLRWSWQRKLIDFVKEKMPDTVRIPEVSNG